jgi:hypothetical protein
MQKPANFSADLQENLLKNSLIFADFSADFSFKDYNQNDLHMQRLICNKKGYRD